MSQAVVLTKTAYDEIVARLERLEKLVEKLSEQLQSSLLYGSDKWWEWSDKESLKEVKRGEFVLFDSPEEMEEYLNSL